MKDKFAKLIQWLKDTFGFTKPKPDLAKAFNAYNAKARENQTKPMHESRVFLFAVMESLTLIPKHLTPLGWDIAGERSMASARFRACAHAWQIREGWVAKVPVSLFCESRSASPRWENALREAIKSYYSLERKGHWVVVPDKVDPESAFIVRIG